MFGFRFLENFDYPYISRSVTEFWRRWHISLSSWFRDYLYIPIGGNRGGAARTLFNLTTVFFLCGLWHGASWSFVIWGLYQGAFLVVERLGFGSFLSARSRAVRHVYVMLVAMVGWVFFRSPDAVFAGQFLKAMCGLGAAPGTYEVQLFLDPVVACAIVAGVIGSVPWVPRLADRFEAWKAGGTEPRLRTAMEVVGHLALAVVFLLSSLELSAGTYNPFIYFRF